MPIASVEDNNQFYVKQDEEEYNIFQTYAKHFNYYRVKKNTIMESIHTQFLLDMIKNAESLYLVFLWTDWHRRSLMEMILKRLCQIRTHFSQREQYVQTHIVVRSGHSQVSQHMRAD